MKKFSSKIGFYAATALVIGILGNIILFACSSVIEDPITIIAPKPNGSVVIRDTIMGHSFWSFIANYNLTPVFLLFCFLIILGIIGIYKAKHSTM